MNIVSIDPSLTCTAMVVNDKKFVYTTSSIAHTKKRELKRWFKECEDQEVYIHTFDDISSSNLTHSDSEISKLQFYSKIASTIAEDIEIYINHQEPTIVAIEGYSYSSAAGPLIDLVTFGTLLRRSIHNNFKYIESIENGNDLPQIQIYQPTEVKQRAAALIYPAIIKGKKTEYRNADGIAGGSFKKHQIYQALLDYELLNDDNWVHYLKTHADEILEMKSVPKPIEDINDAKILYEIVKSAVNLNK